MIGKSRIGLTGLKICETNWPTPNLFVLGFILPELNSFIIEIILLVRLLGSV